MLPKTPEIENEHMTKLMDKLNNGYNPEYVEIKPEPFSQLQQCFGNVEQKVKKDGGSAHYGWAIFISEIMIEAERHAVWENDNGDLVDVTPRDYGITTIVFVSDQENFVYRGQLIDNVRLNITKNPVVDDFILLCETLEELYTYGTRRNDDELEMPDVVLPMVNIYEHAMKPAWQVFLSQGGTVDSKCFCSSGMSYKRCCGKGIRAKFISDKMHVNKELKGIRPLA
jgi:hypothetical protein